MSSNDILDMYIYETNSLLEQLETIVLDAEKENTFSQDNVNEIFRIMHTIKGSSAMMESPTGSRTCSSSSGKTQWTWSPRPTVRLCST